MGGSTPRSCFVVSAFGKTSEEQRAYKQVLRHLIGKTLEPAYTVVRADQIDDEGLITNQIIEHLIEDDLVIADLTDLNPNVFYEVAVRHAARKPIVHLITKGQEIPFDVANMRAVLYALDDPDVLEAAQEDLLKKVKSIEDSGFEAAPNPVSAAVDVSLLRGSEEPEVRETGQVLASLQELRDDVRNLARRVQAGAGVGEPRRRATVSEMVLAWLRANGPATSEDLIRELGVPAGSASRTLRRLLDEGAVARSDDGRWAAIG
jgi:DNA-binding transcriptional ArsR family regulator